ncbi:magnesium transporter CorA family protein [Patescibacteria group bacterium]|nr:magnesium transporter CorA family protein [Patescibacteria group bacterium]MCG2702252.1 magnesium transporter CorA family protein [Candidatus Parcubacteria bacterium]MBU4210034.1 magnesium transporter CorA family protein [Patescibacteria group bacterium]MBU4264734.1 magnesium transporter CorA family protein [Patescibacteria group bacterium]MBU4390072.1 magnesium transporter CorA family protein [Patescibacteria group bacterium]
MDIYYKSVNDKELKSIEQTRKGVWIDFQNISKKDLKQIVLLTGLKHEDVDDALDRFELPRIEKRGGNIIIFLRVLDDNPNDRVTETFVVILTDEILITACTGENELVKRMLERKDEDLNTTQKSKLLLQILSELSRDYTKEIKNINNQVLKQRKEIEQADESDIKRLLINEEKLNQLLSSLIPTKNVFEAIIQKKYVRFYEYDRDLFEDVFINIKQSVDTCLVNLKSVISIRSAYQTIDSNRLNQTMKLLTSFTIILTIPTILSSFYGMNVKLPVDQNPLAWLFLMGLAIFVSLLTYAVFRLKRWL